MLERAYILHHRPYRETSVIFDLMTENHGRIAVIARGVRQARSKWKSLLQSFTPLLISFQGRGELQFLNQAESAGLPIRLHGAALLSGLYLNEILTRLLQKHDPHPGLYTIYEKTLLELQGCELDPKHLRLFEKKMLEELGYGLQLMHEVDGSAIKADALYRFHPELGFSLAQESIAVGSIFTGLSLLDLRAEVFSDVTSLRDAKRLMRLALLPLLGHHKIHSRRLFSTKVGSHEKNQ